MVAQLHDGHGYVVHGDPELAFPPFRWEWIENRLVIVQVAAGEAKDLKPGDVVLQVDGKPAAQALADLETMIAGATPQWRRFRGLQELAAGPPNSELVLEIQSATGPPHRVSVSRKPGAGELEEKRPPKIAEIKPGIWYVDLDRADDKDLDDAVPKLEKAKGIVFDLRGYPKSEPRHIGHLIDKPVTCAQWHIPVNDYPDRTRTRFNFTHWDVPPLPPRYKGKIAFLTDGRAISYAETYLGIIEHYKLGTIVGSPTAGTNGNVNPFALPGGYAVVWTGMKVLKQDGSQHHGIGILPTVPAARTIRGVAEGRDEVLERGVEVVGQ